MATDKAQVRMGDIEVSLPSFSSNIDVTPVDDEQVNVHRPSDPQNFQRNRENSTASKNNNNQIDNSFGQTYQGAAQIDHLQNEIMVFEERLDKTNKRLNLGRNCVIGCFNLIIVSLLVIVFFMVKSTDDPSKQEQILQPNEFDIVTSLIDVNNDDTGHIDLEKSVMKRFKEMAGKISNMKQQVKGNDKDVSLNSLKHKSNAKAVGQLQKNGKSRISRLENLMSKFQNKLGHFMNGTEHDMGEFETKHFVQLHGIFDETPKNFLSSKMKSSYQILGEFDIVDAILDGKMIYDKTNAIIKTSTYSGQVNKQGQKDGIGRYMDKTIELFFEGEFKENKRTGYGRQIYKNGNVYQGDVYNATMHGYGKIYFFTGKYKGRTLSGEYVKSRCINQCVWAKIDYK